MGIAHDAMKIVGQALRKVRSSNDKLVSQKLVRPGLRRLTVTSPNFTDGGSLPLVSTVDGAGYPPRIEWDDLPPGTRSLVLVCEDPDAPLPEPFVHWLVYGIPSSARALDSKVKHEIREGENSKLGTGFTPAAPPRGHGIHHYHFEVFALDSGSDFPQGIGRDALIENMRDHILGWGDIVGTYERS